MTAVHQLIAGLRARSDIGVADEPQSWRVSITKEKLFCEVTIPRDILEWFASVKEQQGQTEVWSDWMDYSGYDDRPRQELEIEMARDILAFINRVSDRPLILPLKIYEPS